MTNDSAKIGLLTRAPKIVDRGQAAGISIDHGQNLHSEGRYLTLGWTDDQRRRTKDECQHCRSSSFALRCGLMNVDSAGYPCASSSSPRRLTSVINERSISSRRAA